MKVAPRLAAGQQREAAGASLREAVSIVGMIVPVRARDRGPHLACAILAQVEEAVPRGREHPFVEAAGVGVAADIVEVQRNLPEALSATENGENAAPPRSSAHLFPGQHAARPADLIQSRD